MSILKYFFSACLSIGLSAMLHAQSFIFNQLFQPSMRINSEYAPQATLPFGEGTDKISYAKMDMNFIIPIKSKLGLKVDWQEALKAAWNFRSLKLKDIGKVARVKMYQIFWTARPQVYHLQYASPDTSLAQKLGNPQTIYGLNTGFSGVHTLRGLRLLFYSANIGFMESQTSIRKMHPSFTGLIGVVHLNRLFYYWYYGAYLNYNNGRVIPAPFFGIEANLARKLWLSITLPVQMRLGWQLNKSSKIDFNISLQSTANGYSPLDLLVDRNFFTDWQLRVSAIYTLRLGKQTKLFLEGGMIPWRKFTLGKGVVNYHKLDAKPAPYVGLSLYFSFRKSLLGDVVDNLLKF